MFSGLSILVFTPLTGVLFCLIYFRFLVHRFVWFMILFEFIMLPMALFIFLAKTSERMSALQFFLSYTLVFSTLIFCAILKWSLEGDLTRVFCAGPDLGLLRILLVVGFGVKFPVFFMHFWLPRAHVEASTVGSMILASCLLKLGSYGLTRLVVSTNLLLDKWFIPVSVGVILSSV